MLSGAQQTNKKMNDYNYTHTQISVQVPFICAGAAICQICPSAEAKTIDLWWCIAATKLKEKTHSHYNVKHFRFFQDSFTLL